MPKTRPVSMRFGQPGVIDQLYPESATMDSESAEHRSHHTKAIFAAIYRIFLKHFLQ